jgi:DNA segregation ATPase FtsK/SpoIIIE-like protein
MTPRDYPTPALDLLCPTESDHERERAEQAEADALADRLAEHSGVHCLSTPIPTLLRRAS